ncbi:ribosome biogenesis GTPase [Orenia metallireducens]|uniref:Small ribosomal subunit biogenesis GTPase RsgA n=1 Tax=Orenia metallireducens TaxID=1413210 RepID=A0A285FFZ7_9FIRM|nr:ribosome small subunit-dependent GTPase A [Orenia metallireducens]PRX33527.1 ribosome biogenesis GTPase [Orenia metallireducens]SNY10187.1 ribosome biogenesis GTPase [Orenia metallireducens]
MKEGRILKAFGGFFYVYDFESKETYECRARGRLKQEKVDIIAGDIVNFTIFEDQTGVVENRKERDNYLFRPPIANVEQVVITSAIREPDLHYKLLDRLLVLAEAEDFEIIICINKVDLSGLEVAKEVLKPYEQVKYKVIYTSVEDNLGIDELRQALKDKVSVFAGPSGVGKSSLLNVIQPGLELKMGEVSERIKRGRHTTRHVELLPLEFGGWVADTPGFSSLDVSSIASEDLQYFFPEILESLDDCKFYPCSHSHEPKCGVKDALEQGKIAEHRYENYLEFLAEIEQAEEKNWRR